MSAPESEIIHDPTVAVKAYRALCDLFRAQADMADNLFGFQEWSGTGAASMETGRSIADISRERFEDAENARYMAHRHTIEVVGNALGKGFEPAAVARAALESEYACMENFEGELKAMEAAAPVLVLADSPAARARVEAQSCRAVDEIVALLVRNEAEKCANAQAMFQGAASGFTEGAMADRLMVTYRQKQASYLFTRAAIAQAIQQIETGTPPRHLVRHADYTPL